MNEYVYYNKFNERIKMLVYDKKEKNIYYTLCVLLNKINNHLLNEELSKYNYIKNNCNYLSNITIKLYNENAISLVMLKFRFHSNHLLLQPIPMF